MKRRDLIKLGAAAAGTGMLPACGVPKQVADMRGEGGSAEWNAMLDEQLGNLARPGLLQSLVGNRAKRALTPADRERMAAKDEMFRRLLGTVLVTQSFRELPEGTRSEQAVQTRMWSHYDQIGSSIFEIGDMLAALSPHDQSRLKTVLDSNPAIAMDIGEAIDTQAARAGISRARRKQLKQMMSQTTFRLESNHGTAMIDEYVTKVERLKATDERHAQALELAAQLNERAFWKAQQRFAQDPPGAASAPATGGASTSAPPPTQIETLTQSARIAARRGDCRATEVLGARVAEIDLTYYQTVFATDPEILTCQAGISREPPGPAMPSKHRPGSTGLRVGGYMLGVGFGIGLVSVILLNAGGAGGVGLVGLTVGALMIGIGLLVLVFSALVYLLE
ncbi:MAG TPA: hypothetical protein VK427_01125 [Kofleriaceae bacterium]|nr:hypothetical protein [Kofleriaceae bacterium]